MSAKGKCGMHIDLSKVPTRQANMKAWEILLSESQERMLICVHKGQEQLVIDVFEKWDLECAQIGEVTDTGHLEFYYEGELVADVPADPLVLGGGAPVYQPEYQKPKYIDQVNKFNSKSINQPKDLKKVARTVFSSPNIVSKRWIYEQYDSMVRTNNMGTNAPSDASLVRIKGTNKALALTVDCNSTYVHADPYTGAVIAVAEAARNIVCSGGTPVAITNCLNLGSPKNPEVYWQFVNVIKGMGDACRKFDTPVTGGNVSFYNQSVLADRTEPIFPTPTIGMLGILEDVKYQMTLSFKKEGHLIYMIGTPQNDINCSEYLRLVHKVQLSPAPTIDLDEEFHIQLNLSKLIRRRLIESAHDVSEGGLFTTLLESAMAGNIGFEAETDDNFRKDVYLFSESQSRIVITCTADKEDDLVNYLNTHNIPFTRIGEVTGKRVLVDGEDYGTLSEWKAIYDHTLGQKMENAI
jgi:phosphoribosylformylglycinamidine synthase